VASITLVNESQNGNISKELILLITAEPPKIKVSR